MNSKLLHLVLIVVLVLLFGALLGGTYGVNKLLTSEGNTLVTAKAKDQALSQEKISLDKAKEDAARYDNLNKIAQAVVPQDKNQAEAVREIVNIADENHITLVSINFPASTLGNLANGAAGASPGAATPAAAPTTTNPAAAAANAKTANLSQLTALKNIPGVYQLPITIANDSNHPAKYTDFINFLNALEQNRRTAQVQNITITPDTSNRNNLTFSLTLNEYIKP